MPCYSPLKGFVDEETGGLTFRRDGKGEEMEVACSQCLGCRLDRSRMWAMRIVHESSLYQHTNGNCFVTLTYDPEKIPEDWSLHKDHFQKFMKRLRKAHPNQKIKYYHAGEYGSICKHGFDLERQKCPLCNVGRPHYHACLFNISFDDLEIYKTQSGRSYYTSQKLEAIWKYGFVDVGKLEYQSAAYVARYILKKVNGVNQKDHYQRIEPSGEITPLEPEYSTMSNGIGKEWYKKYRADVYPSDETPVPGQGVIKGTPRYYEQMLKEEDPETHEMIKEKRQAYKRENWEDFEPGRLMSKYKIKKAQTTQLSRNL